MLEKWHSSRFDWPNLRWPRMESSFFCFYAHFHFHIKCTATHFLPLKFDHKILSPPQKSADTGMASKFCFSSSKANCPAFHAWANDFPHHNNAAKCKWSQNLSSLWSSVFEALLVRSLNNHGADSVEFPIQTGSFSNYRKCQFSVDVLHIFP